MLITLSVLVGCNSSNDKADPVEIVENKSPIGLTLNDYPAGLAIPQNKDVTDYRVLFFGNSHSAGLPALLTVLVEHGLPNKTIYAERQPDYAYLDDRLLDKVSAPLLVEQPWTQVILQAQKYSQSGSVEYSTTGAQTWIRMAKSKNITPILYPEHPQRGNLTEGRLVHELHLSIAEKEASCVAPVGLVWDKVLSLSPSEPLYSADGNHASKTGQVLTAFVIYEMVTGEPADILPYIDALEVSEEQQAFYKQIVTQIISEDENC